MIQLRILALIGLVAASTACGEEKQASATATANSLAGQPQGTATEWQRTASGIQYRRISGNGTGPRPRPTDVVTLHYVGKLMDGTEFDSSFRGGVPVTMALPQLIPGWQEGVPLMSVGDIYEFVIPPELGYGDREAGPIPAGSTLHFTIGLIGIGGQG